MHKELLTWAKYKCFSRKPCSEARNIINTNSLQRVLQPPHRAEAVLPKPRRRLEPDSRSEALRTQRRATSIVMLEHQHAARRRFS